MITSFLICAMSLPGASFHKPLSIGEVRLVQSLVSYDQDRRPLAPKHNRVILIGTSPQWAMQLRALGLQAWRLVYINPEARWDVVSSAFQQPIRPRSVGMVIYGLSGSSHYWSSMKALSECILSLSLHGFLVFDPLRCPRFAPYLRRLWFERLPFDWNGWEIWRRTREGSTHGGVIRIRDDVAGNVDRALQGLFGQSA